jgi:hypothetical protein
MFWNDAPPMDSTDRQFPAAWSNMVPGWTWREWWESYDPPNFSDHVYDILNGILYLLPSSNR